MTLKLNCAKATCHCLTASLNSATLAPTPDRKTTAPDSRSRRFFSPLGKFSAGWGRPPLPQSCPPRFSGGPRSPPRAARLTRGAAEGGRAPRCVRPIAG